MLFKLDTISGSIEGGEDVELVKKYIPRINKMMEELKKESKEDVKKWK